MMIEYPGNSVLGRRLLSVTSTMGGKLKVARICFSILRFSSAETGPGACALHPTASNNMHKTRRRIHHSPTRLAKFSINLEIISCWPIQGHARGIERPQFAMRAARPQALQRKFSTGSTAFIEPERKPSTSSATNLKPQALIASAMRAKLSSESACGNSSRAISMRATSP